MNHHDIGTEQSKDELTEIFKMCDVNNDGVLSKEEIEAVVKNHFP